MIKPTHLDRSIKLWLYKNGELEYTTTENGRAKHASGAIPVFSVNNQVEAELIQTGLCRNIDGNTYVLPFTGKFEDVDRVTQLFSEFYALYNKGYKGSDLGEPYSRYKNDLGLF